MLRAIDVNASDAFAYSMQWQRKGFMEYGAVLVCRVTAPWVSPYEPTLWHQRWARGRQVALDETYLDKVNLFLEFWPQVGFAVAPTFVQGYEKLTVGDAQRSLVGAFELQKAGYSQHEVIAVARGGRLDEMVSYVREGMPKEYIAALLGEMMLTGGKSDRL